MNHGQRWFICFLLSSVSFSVLPDEVGSVWMLQGEVTRLPASQLNQAKSLALGQTLMAGDTLEAVGQATAVVRMSDGAMLALRPNSKVTLDAVHPANTATDQPRFWLSVLKGGLRVISGMIAKQNPAAYRITTSTATIGIRGTDHETYQLEDSVGSFRPGTYDKVNSGGTTLEAAGRSVNLQPGDVGFARDRTHIKPTPKALATLLYPTILKSVPGFFTTGPFDGLMDSYRLPQDQGSQPSACDAGLLARQWLGRLDNAINQKDEGAVLAHFLPTATISVMDKPPSESRADSPVVTLDGQQFAQAASESLKGLTDFKHTRVSIDTTTVGPDHSTTCGVIEVRSRVQESGVSYGVPYATTATEHFKLTQHNGRWLASEARLYPATQP